MRKLKYVVLVVLLVLSFNVKASDSDCDKKENARLKELANKVEFDYDYKLAGDKAVFSINAVNLNEELKVLIIKDYYNDDYKEFKDNSTHKDTLDGFESGEKVTITIKGYVPNWCSGKTMLTKTIRLPYYNYFYDEEKCKGNEDFKYCKQLIDSNITQSEFDKQFELYLKSKEPKEEPVDTKPVDTDNTLYYIIGGGVLVVIVGVVIVSSIIKRRKKNML